MSDDFEKLTAALRSAAPAPDPEARARAIAQAMENYDRLQASTALARPKEDRPETAGFLYGVRKMLNLLSAKPALAATTSVAALLIGVAVILPVMGDLTTPSKPALPQEGQSAPAALPPPAAEMAGTEEVAAPDSPVAAMVPAEPPVVAESNGAYGSSLASGAEARMAEPEAATAMAKAAPAPAPVNPEVGGQAALADADGMSADAAAPEMLNSGEIAAAEPVGELRLQARAAAPAAPDALYLPAPQASDEAYANAAANPVRITAEEPVSTFSTDVDTASWAVVRQSLNAGQMPLPEQVRVEEMVNYFPYAYAAPEGDAAFATNVAVMPTPWNPDTRLVTIGLQGALPAIAERPPLNLVFLVDTSGSMEAPNKLGLLKQSLALMLPELRPEDQVAIVAYAGSAGQVLAPTAAGERDKILTALDNLSAGGSTAGAEGLELAYRLAAEMSAPGDVSRVLLATDGDFNVGVSDPEGLEHFIAGKRAEGTYLSVLGFGRGNLDDAVMQALAQNGNGTASYIDSLSEARKVLVDQLTGTLFPIADDVKVQVEWNPAQVAEYRLIGYETRALRREDFSNDKVDAGEIGAGLQVTAIYEVTAPGSAGLRNEPLRYGAGKAAEAMAEGADPLLVSDELGFLRLRWKAPGESLSQLVETPIHGLEPATDETRFAVAIAGFGQLLAGSSYLGDWSWPQVIELALSARGSDPYGYRVEAVNLMRLAESLDR